MMPYQTNAVHHNLPNPYLSPRSADTLCLPNRFNTIVQSIIPPSTERSHFDENTRHLKCSLAAASMRIYIYIYTHTLVYMYILFEMGCVFSGMCVCVCEYSAFVFPARVVWQHFYTAFAFIKWMKLLLNYFDRLRENGEVSAAGGWLSAVLD